MWGTYCKEKNLEIYGRFDESDDEFSKYFKSDSTEKIKEIHVWMLRLSPARDKQVTTIATTIIWDVPFF